MIASRLSLLILTAMVAFETSAQRPVSGSYAFRVRFAEHPQMIGPDCRIVVQGDSVFVYAIDDQLSLVKSGEVLDKGILLRHHKTKKWIVGKRKEDADAEEIGGCSDGPRIIDFKRKEFWLC